MITAPETPEGGVPLPNEAATIPNFSMLHVKNVVVHGYRRWSEEDKHFKYRPVLSLFLSEPGQDPVMLNLELQAQFDDGEVMARMGVTWANNMFTKVSKMVSIFDVETTDLVVKHNVMELIELEAAEDEYREIQFTNKYKIH